jgi:hypothetical protein
MDAVAAAAAATAAAALVKRQSRQGSKFKQQYTKVNTHTCDLTPSTLPVNRRMDFTISLSDAISSW